MGRRWVSCCALAGLAAVLALLNAACSSSGTQPSASGPVELTTATESTDFDADAAGENLVRSRMVPPDYEGMAYPVPSSPEPGDHINDVRVDLVDDDGAAAGSAYVPAGTPQIIRPASEAPDLVEIAWDGGLTAVAQRSDFWIVPDFIKFRDVEVRIDGVVTPIGQTDLLYNRVPPGNFDDPDTPEYDGIASPIRRFLHCEADVWNMGNQYFAVDVSAEGTYRADRSIFDKGVTGIEWGIARELGDDAVFSLYRECDDLNQRDPGETHHSSQWFAAMGRGVYLMAASPYAGEYRSNIDRYLAHVEKLATMLATETVREHWVDQWLFEPNGDVFTHKYYMRAAGMALASSHTADRATADLWAADAKWISELGMQRQTPEGVNPERGGFDVRYQMYGTWLAAVYYSTLIDGPHREALADTIDDAIAWQLTKTDPETGVVNIDGSSRSCHKNSDPAEYHPYHMISAFLLWSEIRPGNEELADQAVLADTGHRTGAHVCG